MTKEQLKDFQDWFNWGSTESVGRDFDEFKSVLDAVTDEACKSQESARDYLVKLGTHNPDGTLTDEFKQR